jgi:cyclopropane-fatty-acyl-phospholipid synthase
MPNVIEPVAESTVSFLNGLFAETPVENVSFQLWDGTLWPDERPRAATLVLKHPGALREMLASGTAKGLAEAYLRDDFDVRGDIEAGFELALALENRPKDWFDSLLNYHRLHRLPTRPGGRHDGRDFDGLKGRAHSLERDRQAVSFHYDVSNDFYRLWLDREMVYSCAYFERADEDLDRAQQAKLRHVCRKLRLRPGQRLLDIGCGWGALAIHAAQEYGVSVTGVTLSARQAELAAACAAEAGVAQSVSIELRDYRELKRPEEFDAVVSVGMSEHVGRNHLPEYFATVKRLLKPGGVFLNHAIGEKRPGDRFRGPSFVNEYVFPDGDIPAIPLVVQAAEDAGLEVRDVENLREHYALTLRHWVRRLEAAHDRALAFVNEPTYRVWRLYMAGSAHGFDHGDLAVYQTLLAKTDAAGRAHLPLTRRDWYA